MKIVTIAAMKGGVGKTMMTTNIAGCLAKTSKVLVIDADPQSNTTNALRLDIADLQRKSLADIFEDDSTAPEDVVVKRPIEELENLDVLPGSILLYKTELNLFSRASREKVLRRYVKKHEDFFGKYDYLLLDTSPGMGLINQNAFAVADSIVLVSDVSLNSYNGLELFVDLWDSTRIDLELDDNVKAIIVNLYDQRIKMASEFIEDCKENETISPLLVDVPIYQRVKLKDTELGQTPINVLYPNSDENQMIENVVNELIVKGVF